MSHAELEALQALFYRAIVHPQGVEAFLAAADPDTRAAFDAAFDGTADFDARARMGVYADAYFWRLHDVLLDHFSLVAWILGPARFRNLATDYVLQRPSEDPDVRRFGARLPAFLREHPLVTAVPGIDELAAIEWAMVRALDVPQGPLLQRATLAELPPEGWPALWSQAVASAFVGACHHDFGALWAHHLVTPTPDETPVAGAVNHVLVWRQGLAVMHRAVDASEADALLRLRDGVAFAGLCEHVDAPTAVAWLSRWLDDGLLSA
jgi:hypothetical protein